MLSPHTRCASAPLVRHRLNLARFQPTTGGLRARVKACTARPVPRSAPTMPRYYFHITNRGERPDNPKGMDLPGDAAAREEAVVLANELRPGQVMPGRNWQGWFVTVVDQHGLQVDSVPIADMPDE